MGAFRIGFRGVFLNFPSGQHCADPRLLAHAMYLTSVQGWLMTSMRVRLTCTVSLSALCIGGAGGLGDVDDVDDVDVVLHDIDCLCGR